MTAPPQGVEVEHVEFPAGRIRFYRAGNAGPAVVLLHGGGLSHGLATWRSTIPVLAEDHRVFVPDLPKQGGSQPWHGRANQRNLEEVLRWLLDHWEIKQAVLIGHSIGGSVATGFALRHPDRVQGLVLADSEGLQARTDKHPLRYALTRAGFPGSVGAKLIGMNKSVAKQVLVHHIFTGSQPVPDLDAIAEEVRAEAATRSTMLTEWEIDSLQLRGTTTNHLPRLGQLRCPTMLIHGEKDAIVPLSCSRAAATALPQARLRIVQDTGHWPHRERPNEFNAFVREFVNNH